MDHSSCGIYTMKFAEQYLTGVPLNLKEEEVLSTRMEIAKKLLLSSDSLDDCCRCCSYTETGSGVWVQCDKCESWYHQRCINFRTKQQYSKEYFEKAQFTGPCCSEARQFELH